MVSMVLIFLLSQHTPFSVLRADSASEFDYTGPRCDSLVFPLITTKSAQLIALKTGEVAGMAASLWADLPLTQIPEIEKDPELSVVSTVSTTYFTMPMNCRKRPLNILEFRRALAHCIDKDYLSKTIFYGYYPSVQSCIPPAYGGDWSNPKVKDPYGFDLKRAAQLLDSIRFVDTDGNGVRNDPTTGKDLSPLRFLIPSYSPERVRMAQIISAQAKEVGIPIEVVPSELGTMIDEIQSKRTFDLCCWSYGWFPAWDNIQRVYHSAQAVPGGGNDAGYYNATWDQLIDRMMTTSNREELRDLIWKFQEWHMQYIPDYPLVLRVYLDIGSKKVDGWLTQSGVGIFNPWTYMNIRPKGVAQGGVVKIPIIFDPKHVNPTRDTTGMDNTIIQRIYDSLLTLDLERSIAPNLAKEYSIKTLDNGTMVIRFQLNTNVKWHDGQPFTSEDVKYSLESYRDKKVVVYLPYLKGMYRVEAPDKYTVDVYISSSSYTAVYNIGVLCSIVPKHIWKDIKEDWSNYDVQNPIGTGPFKFVKWAKGEYLQLDRNPDYFRSYKPKPLTFKLSLSSNIAVTFTVDGKEQKDPVSLDLPKGTHKISVPEYVTIGGERYKFVRWEDQSANPQRTIDLTGDLKVAATYEKEATGPPWGYIIAALVVVAVVSLIAVRYTRKRKQ